MHGKVAAASKIAIHLRISRKVRRPRCNGHNSKLSARSSSVNRHEVPRLTKDYGPRLLALCSAPRGTLAHLVAGVLLLRGLLFTGFCNHRG